MDYIPKKDSDKVIWNNNFNVKIDLVGRDLGLDPAEITNIQRVCTDNAAAIIANDDAQTAARSAKTAKDSQLKVGEKSS